MYNNTMYKQTDRAAMASPLGLLWPTSLLDIMKKKLFSQTQKPQTYFRNVDDTFSIFDHEAEADEFLILTKLNCLHPSLKFPLKKRKTNVYRFLMLTSKEQILALKPVYSANPLSPASIYVGSPLVLSNVK